MPQQAPNVNGVMELATDQSAAIKAALIIIRDGFKPTDEEPICDTFYLVSAYNKQNIGKEINGDTAESILK